MPVCRECHIEINKDKDDWIMPSKNYYYHRTCYETWKARMPETDDDWVPRIYDFLARDLKVSYNYFIKGNQWEKGHGGLGIVPYVFEDAKAYWVAQERQRHGFMKELENQIKEREVVKVKRTTKKREKYNLDDI